MEKHHLSPFQIVLELTEKEAVLNDYSWKEQLIIIDNRAFELHWDDVGTGYNSLQTLINVKPQIY